MEKRPLTLRDVWDTRIQELQRKQSAKHTRPSKPNGGGFLGLVPDVLTLRHEELREYMGTLLL